jgi:hypothetical protein
MRDDPVKPNGCQQDPKAACVGAVIRTRRSGSSAGQERRSAASATLNTAAFTPIPNARDADAASVKSGTQTAANSAEQRKLLETLLSNCVYERGTLTPTYRRPFDLLAKGTEMKEWLGGRDSNPEQDLFLTW